MTSSPTSNYNKKFFASEKPEQHSKNEEACFEKLDKKTLLAEETLLKNKITAFSFCEELDMIIFGL
jgi:hypothetical protein